MYTTYIHFHFSSANIFEISPNFYNWGLSRPQSSPPSPPLAIRLPVQSLVRQLPPVAHADSQTEA